MSCDTLRPLPRLEMEGGFGGRLAALMLPRGVEDGVMPAVAAGLETVRAATRSAPCCVGGTLANGLAGSLGEVGEGLPKGESAS